MEEKIKTYLVSGFIESGKTSYIENCIFHDFFHKRGTTLILSFEQGEIEYDENRLKDYRCKVVYYQQGDITAFISNTIDQYQPDRLYIENNNMLCDFPNQFDSRQKLVFSVTLFTKENFKSYFNNLIATIQSMVQVSDMVIFNRFDDKTELEPYATTFQLMNPKCQYLLKTKMGYSEKAFGHLLPYSLENCEINLQPNDYPLYYLDSHENPEKYQGKILTGLFQIQQKDGGFAAGRTVMVCCLADLQFLSYPILSDQLENYGFYQLKLQIENIKNTYGAPIIAYRLLDYEKKPMPKQLYLALNK